MYICIYYIFIIYNIIYIEQLSINAAKIVWAVLFAFENVDISVIIREHYVILGIVGIEVHQDDMSCV